MKQNIQSNGSKAKPSATEDLASRNLGQFGTILADPPWQFTNRTGKMAPEHKRLLRYSTMTLQEIMDLPVAQLALPKCHLYLWVPNALVLEGLEVMKRWGFTYKTNLVWYKIRKDGGPDRRGVGFYFRNVTELILFGTRGKNNRTLAPGRRQENIIVTQKREHSRKPDKLYEIIESCSPGPYLELFARHHRLGWAQWGNEIENPERSEVLQLQFILEKSAQKEASESYQTMLTSEDVLQHDWERPEEDEAWANL
jgi:N6-adenosine-specific RNA methylase IME4